MYYRYSGYKGNLKSMNLRDMLQKQPEEVLRLAVRGMLPKNKLRDSRLKRLKLFVTPSSQFDHYAPQQLPVRG
jgi:large subunit ribosomal protein L13